MRKLFYTIIIFLICFSFCFADNKDSLRIVVFDFADLCPGEYLGKAVAESMIDDLEKVKGITALERLQVTKLQDEINFSNSDLANKKTAAKINKSLDAVFCIIGDVDLSGGEYKLTAKLINLVNRERVFTVKENGSSLFELEDDLIFKVIKFFNLYIDSATKEAIKNRETWSMKAYRQYGKGLHYSEKGLLKKARNELEMAVKIDHEYKKAGALLEKIYDELLKQKRNQLYAIGAWYQIPLLGKLTEKVNPTKYYTHVSTRSFFFAAFSGLLCNSFTRWSREADDESSRKNNRNWAIVTGLFSSYFTYNMIRSKIIEKNIESILAAKGEFSQVLKDGYGLYFFSYPGTEAQKTFFNEFQKTYGDIVESPGNTVGFSFERKIDSRKDIGWGFDIQSIKLKENDPPPGSSVSYDFSISRFFLRGTYNLIQSKRDAFCPYVGAGLGISLYDLEVKTVTGGDSEEVKTKDTAFSPTVCSGIKFYLSSDICFDFSAEYYWLRLKQINKVFARLHGDREFGGITYNLKVSIIFGAN